jgi:hypothetical protein
VASLAVYHKPIATLLSEFLRSLCPKGC